MSNTADLFPPCSKHNCKDVNPKHRHILPHQQEFLDCSERYVALIGGYGSGKTLPACIMGHLLSMTVPGNMGIVLRRSLPKLHDSTERIYLEVLARSGVECVYREKRDGWPHRLIYPNGSEVTFRETTDLGRFLGPEYGWFFIDEAQEEPRKTFTDMMGRLRLPRAADYLRGLIATNPPNQQHWIAETWPKPGAWLKTITIPDGTTVSTTWRMINSSTYDNPFLRPDYVASLLQQYSPSEAKRVIEGYYGFIQEGEPVYSGFDFFRHVGDPPKRVMTLYRVWDFGFHAPACTMGNIFRCKFGKQHMVVMHEVVASDIESEAFAAKVLQATKTVFPDVPERLIVDGGDAAGAQVNEKGPGPIIRLARPVEAGGFNLRFRYQKFADIDPGLDLIRRLLRTKCKCGYHLLMVNRTCRTLIEAMAGGYHYPQQKAGHEKNPKPAKDGFYDNIADTLRYFAMLFYIPLEIGLLTNEVVDGYTPMEDSDKPWAWLNW